MTFEKITEDIPCDCFQDTFEDHETKFTIKINQNVLKEKDFKTYWEKGRRSYENCEKGCSLKSQSISIIKTEEDLQQNIETYKKLFPIAPNYKPFCAIIVFKEESGKIKLTPSKINPLHCDLYKSDTFSKDLVEVIDIIALEDV